VSSGLDMPADDGGGGKVEMCRRKQMGLEFTVTRGSRGEAAKRRAIAAGRAMSDLCDFRLVVRMCHMRRQVQREHQQQRGERSSQPLRRCPCGIEQAHEDWQVGARNAGIESYDGSFRSGREEGVIR